MKTANILALCMVMTVISFLGFLVENIWLALTKGYMDNRNMCLPFLIGYGIAILLIYMILGTPKKLWIFGRVLGIRSKAAKMILYFLGVVLCICVGEVLLGSFVEKVCHFRWWDYSELPLHITRYTSIPTSAMFSLLITTFMQVFFVPLYKLFLGWDYVKLVVMTVTFGILMIGDFVYNAYKMYKTQGLIQRWKIDINAKKVYRRIHS